jgi:hypothetical protein
MREYKASNKVSLLGIPLLFITALLAGLLIGGTAFVISFQFNFFLICIFPLIMGFLGGAFMMVAVRVGKVRSPLLAGLFGLLAGLAIIFVFRAGEYYFTVIHEDAMRAAERRNRDASEQEIIMQSIPIGLQAFDFGQLIEFNQLVAELGTSITYRSSTIELNETMTWILWGIEALAIVLICIIIPSNAAGEPFNERTNRWFKDWQWFASVPLEKRKAFLDFLKQGDFKSAGALMTTGTLPLPRVDIDLTGDDSDSEGDWLVKVLDVRQDRNNTRRDQVTIGLLSPQELSVLRSGLADRDKLKPAN